MTTQQISRQVRGALVHPYNLIVLAFSAGASGALLDLRPVFAGLALEAVYLAVAAVAPEDSAFVRFFNAKPQPDAVPVKKPSAAQPAIVKRKVLPSLRLEIQEQYRTLEYHFESIKGQIDPEADVYREVVTTLANLIDKFLYLGLREQEFKQRLLLLVQESEALKTDAAVHRPVLKIVGGTQNHQASDHGQEETVASLIARAHFGYEARAADLQHTLLSNDPADEHSTALLAALRRRTKHVDRVGKLLATLHHQMNSIGLKFEATDEEILTCTPSQELNDLKALVVETDSITRTIDTVEPLEDIRSSAAA